MKINLIIISNNYTQMKSYKFVYDFNSSCTEFIYYLHKKQCIPSDDFTIFYNNNKIDKIPNLEEISLIVSENKKISCTCKKINY
jgi:hypothetical protein